MTKYFFLKLLPCLKYNSKKSVNNFEVPVTPFGLNRWFLLLSYVIVNALTAYLYLGWAKGLQDMLFRSGAFAWLCPKNSPVVPDYLSRCEKQKTSVGNLLSVSLVSSIVSSVIAGTSLDFFGPKITATTGLIINLSGWILLAESNENLVGYVPAMVLIGIGCNFSSMSIITVARLFPERRRSIIAISTSSASFSMFVMVTCNAIWKTNIDGLSFRGIIWGYVAVASCVALPIVLLLLPLKSFTMPEIKLVNDDHYKVTKTEPVNRENVSISSIRESPDMPTNSKAFGRSIDTTAGGDHSEACVHEEVSNDDLSGFQVVVIKPKSSPPLEHLVSLKHADTLPCSSSLSFFSSSCDSLRNTEVGNRNLPHGYEPSANGYEGLSASLQHSNGQFAAAAHPSICRGPRTSLCFNENIINAFSCSNSNCSQCCSTALASARHFHLPTTQVHNRDKIEAFSTDSIPVSLPMAQRCINDEVIPDSENAPTFLRIYHMSHEKATEKLHADNSDNDAKITEADANFSCSIMDKGSSEGIEMEMKATSEAFLQIPLHESNGKDIDKLQYNTEKFDTAASLPARIELCENNCKNKEDGYKDEKNFNDDYKYVNYASNKRCFSKFCNKYICKNFASKLHVGTIEKSNGCRDNILSIDTENTKPKKCHFIKKIKESLLHPSFICVLKEKIYILAIINFSIALLRSDFLYKTAIDQLGEDVYNVLGYFMPCMCSCTLVLGCLAQKLGPLFGLWIVASVGTLAYIFAVVSNAVTSWLALLFLWMHMCFVQTSMYIFLFELFPAIHFGKLMGVAYLLGGLGSLVCIPIYNAAVLHFKGYLEMDILILGCCAVSFCIISYITYVYLKRKREARECIEIIASATNNKK